MVHKWNIRGISALKGQCYTPVAGVLEMSTRLAITLLLTLIVNAVVFGIGATVVLSVESLSSQAASLLPALIVASFAVSPLISWEIAPLLRARRPIRGLVRHQGHH